MAIFNSYVKLPEGIPNNIYIYNLIPLTQNTSHKPCLWGIKTPFWDHRMGVVSMNGEQYMAIRVGT